MTVAVYRDALGRWCSNSEFYGYRASENNYALAVALRILNARAMRP